MGHSSVLSNTWRQVSYATCCNSAIIFSSNNQVDETHLAVALFSNLDFELIQHLYFVRSQQLV